MRMPHDNPWTECLLRGEFIFEKRFLAYSLGYVLVAFLGNGIRRRYHAAVRSNPNSPPDARGFMSLIASRPTVIAATIHAVSTSVVSAGILIAYYCRDDDDDYGDVDDGSSSPWLYRGTTDLIRIWQRVGLPISLSYFVTDSYFYCLPRRDFLIFVHHCIMCFCHYPVGCTGGATLAGAGDPVWSTWLSIVGYTSEFSTAMMNYRWYLINTLEEDWVGFGIVNGFVVSSWAGRVVLFAHLLIAEIFPRMHVFVERGQTFTYAVMVFGHASIGLLSLHWCIVMCRGGLRSLFVFKKQHRPKVLNPQQGFSFVEEVGGKKNVEDLRGTKRLKIIEEKAHKIIEEEVEAYLDGTLFTEAQAKKGQSKKKQ
ncbi:hypothetical protein ACHAW5_000253 [Stephanodiscus triporus]|uniref:TLC domain-containing protein n=1 Tax=Stephanodiscus triporus TaxID=2934178 RepID=A0ABD3NE45_9STRA